MTTHRRGARNQIADWSTNTISSASRERCVVAIDSAASASSAKSREETESIEVRRWHLKAKRARGSFTIDGIGGAGECGGAEWAMFLHARARIGQTRRVSVEHFDVSHQMMAECDRLRCLQMGEARRDPIGVLPQRALAAHRARAASWLRHRASRPAPRAGSQSPLGRCASARCGAVFRLRRSFRSAALRY